MNTKAIQKVKEVVIQLIYYIEFSNIKTLHLYHWDTTSARFLRFLIVEKILTEDFLLGVLDSKLRLDGRTSYEDHLKFGTDIEHTKSVESLAYAIENDVFTEDEIKRIVLDDSPSLEDFCTRFGCGKDLPKKLLLRLTQEE